MKFYKDFIKKPPSRRHLTGRNVDRRHIRQAILTNQFTERNIQIYVVNISFLIYIPGAVWKSEMKRYSKT